LLINELLQWAAIVFLAVFVLGLTRQLGNFLVPARERALLDKGPAIDDSIEADLLDGDAATRLRDVMRTRGNDWAAVAAIAEDCHGCQALVNQLVEQGMPENAPLLILTASASPTQRERLDRAADIVVVDHERMKRLNLPLPLMFLVDGRLRVRHKALATSAPDALAAWRGSPHADAGSELPLSVVSPSRGV
jgi:hypothetical protein